MEANDILCGRKKKDAVGWGWGYTRRLAGVGKHEEEKKLSKIQILVYFFDLSLCTFAAALVSYLWLSKLAFVVASGLFVGHELVDNRLLSFLFCKASREVFCGSFDDSSNLEIFGLLSFAHLFVMTFSIENMAHSKKLQIPFQLWSHFRLLHIEPSLAGCPLPFLLRKYEYI